MKTKQKIYIAGKIGDLPRKEVEKKFNDAKISLLQTGFQVVSPLENGLPRESAWEQHMRRDIALLCDCDAIFLLSDWIDSPGARFEVSLFISLGHTCLRHWKHGLAGLPGSPKAFDLVEVNAAAL